MQPIYNAFFLFLQLDNPMTKQIILCADDYGQNPAISEGIIKLIQQQRLSATSCMTTSPYWPSHAHWLMPFIQQIDIGLHFNLTEGKALAELPQLAHHGQFPSLPKLLLKILLRRIDPKEIEAELNQQLEQFVAAFGKLPDFIDGHQHIQHLPIIRDVILTYYEKHLRQHKIYLRCVSENNLKQLLHGRARVKRSIIQFTGSKVFKDEVVAKKIPHNASFAGIYNFSQANKFARIFPEFLKTITQGGLIMCHPGLSSTDASAIYSGRHFEYEYFASEKFIADCDNQQVELVRFGGRLG